LNSSTMSALTSVRLTRRSRLEALMISPCNIEHPCTRSSNEVLLPGTKVIESLPIEGVCSKETSMFRVNLITLGSPMSGIFVLPIYCYSAVVVGLAWVVLAWPALACGLCLGGPGMGGPYGTRIADSHIVGKTYNNA
jgi:hypothetical protein